MWETGSLPVYPSLIPDNSLCTSPDAELDDLGNLLHIPNHSSPSPPPASLPAQSSEPTGVVQGPQPPQLVRGVEDFVLGGRVHKPNSGIWSTWGEGGWRWLEGTGSNGRGMAPSHRSPQSESARQPLPQPVTPHSQASKTLAAPTLRLMSSRTVLARLVR